VAASESDLIEKARNGDHDAFAALYAPVERPLAAFLYRLIAARQDAEDLAQETAVRALESISGFGNASSFRAWIFRMAAEIALEYLRGKKSWDPDTHIRAGEQPQVRRELQRLHGSKDHTTYHIGEHIDFCFICLGRAVPPHETAALLLVEVHGFSPAEAVEVLGTTAEVLRLRVTQARQTLADHLDSRCSLINKDGACTQCASLDTLLHGDRRHTEQALFGIDLAPSASPVERAAAFDRHLAIIRSIDPLHAEGTRLHDSLMTMTRRLGRY